MNDLIRHLTYTNCITTPLSQMTGPYQGLRLDGRKDFINYIRMFFNVHLYHSRKEKLSPQDVVNVLTKTLPQYGIENKMRKMTLISTPSNNEAILESARADSFIAVRSFLKDAVDDFVNEFTAHMTLVQFSDDPKLAEEESREINTAIDYFINLLLELVSDKYYPEIEAIDVLKKEMDKPTEIEELVFYVGIVDDDVVIACQELMNHPGPKSLICRLNKKFNLDWSTIPDKPEMFPHINQDQ